MRNVTVSLPDDVYRRARVAAAERDLSLSALVREFLAEAVEVKADFNRRKRLQAETLAGLDPFDASDRLSRDELYRR